MPTCMSAVPRSAGPPCSAASCNASLVGAHRVAEPTLRDPDVRQGDRAAEDVGRCARPAAGCAMHSAYARCAASRSPLAQDASPSSAAAAPRPRWSSSGDELERPPGMSRCAAQSPSARA